MHRSPLLAAVALVLALTACGGDPEPEAGPSPGSIQVSGQLTLSLPNFEWNPGVCSGRGGYDDLTGGAQVVVTDNTGATVAMGSLGDGNPRLDPADSSRAIACVFPFAVGVPAGKGFYGIAVAGRDRVQVKEADLADVKMELS